MQKIITLTLVLFIIILTFAGCAKLIRSDETIVDATIVDTYHKNAWIQPMRVGKVTTFINHPAKHCVVVEYDGIKLTINDREIYQQYKDQIGQTIKCKLITDYYDDNTCKQYLKFGD